MKKNRKYSKVLRKTKALKNNKITFFAKDGIYYEVDNKLIFIKD